MELKCSDNQIALANNKDLLEVPAVDRQWTQNKHGKLMLVCEAINSNKTVVIRSWLCNYVSTVPSFLSRKVSIHKMGFARQKLHCWCWFKYYFSVTWIARKKDQITWLSAYIAVSLLFLFVFVSAFCFFFVLPWYLIFNFYNFIVFLESYVFYAYCLRCLRICFFGDFILF